MTSLSRICTDSRRSPQRTCACFPTCAELSRPVEKAIEVVFRDLLFVGEGRILETLSGEISELIMLHNQPLCHDPEDPDRFISCSENQ